MHSSNGAGARAFLPLPRAIFRRAPLASPAGGGHQSCSPCVAFIGSESPARRWNYCWQWPRCSVATPLDQWPHPFGRLIAGWIWKLPYPLKESRKSVPNAPMMSENRRLLSVNDPAPICEHRQQGHAQPVHSGSGLYPNNRARENAGRPRVCWSRKPGRPLSNRSPSAEHQLDSTAIDR